MKADKINKLNFENTLYTYGLSNFTLNVLPLSFSTLLVIVVPNRFGRRCCLQCVFQRVPLIPLAYLKCHSSVEILTGSSSRNKFQSVVKFSLQKWREYTN